MNVANMPLSHADVRFNYCSYRRLSRSGRCEIIDGALYRIPTPGTAHQRISLNLSAALLRHVRERDLGAVLEAPCDVLLSYENILQPDILYVRNERSGIIGEMSVLGAPDLVVEILSKESRVTDLGIKRRVYAGFGIPEYWVVDPEAATIEIRVWSELGYISAGVWRKPERVLSPLLPEVNRSLAGVFRD